MRVKASIVLSVLLNSFTYTLIIACLELQYPSLYILTIF